MKFCLVINETKKQAQRIANIFTEALNKKGIMNYVFNGEIEQGTNFAIVFGGDGTILKFIRTGKVKVPVLGINCGNMGFLAEVYDQTEDFISKLLKGEYEIDNRRLLRVDAEGQVFHALNEVTLGRADSINLMDIEVSTDDVTLDKYRADGVIVATPTGSTAYSLSAGGPVLSPKVSAFIVTPICPHSLHSRPIVLADSEIINITVRLKGKCLVVVDGLNVVTSENAFTMRVSTDDKSVQFVRMHKCSFYETMVSKFNRRGNA